MCIKRSFVLVLAIFMFVFAFSAIPYADAYAEKSVSPLYISMVYEQQMEPDDLPSIVMCSDSIDQAAFELVALLDVQVGSTVDIGDYLTGDSIVMYQDEDNNLLILFVGANNVLVIQYNPKGGNNRLSYNIWDASSSAGASGFYILFQSAESTKSITLIPFEDVLTAYNKIVTSWDK